MTELLEPKGATRLRLFHCFNPIINPYYYEGTLMNSRAQDINLLKIALVPAVIMMVVVGILFILVTNINAMVAIDTPRPAAQLTTMDAMLTYCPSASLASMTQPMQELSAC